MGEPDVANPTLRGDQVLHRLSAGARDAVQRMAKVLRASEAVVLLAAYYLLLARHGAGPDIVVGSPVNVRGPRAQRALGYHVNVLPLRVAVNLEGSFVDLVHLVRKVFMGALAHADLSVDVLLEEVPRRDVSWHNALFRHVFNYVPGEGLPPFELAGLTAEPVVVENGFSKFDLEFFVLSSPESIGLRAAYCVEAFARADVAALLGRYDRLLQTLGQDIAMPVGEADLFSTNDREIVDRANGTDRAVPLTSVLDGIRSRALTDPDATALEFEDRRVSYGQLWQAARETAAELRASGVAAGVVAVLGPRSPELAAAVLGVWLCGAAYLPLDPNHPADRLRHQLDDARTAVVLAADPATVPDADSRAVRSFRPVPNGSAGAEAAGGEGEQVPHDAGTLDPDSCAYLIYTSGSTGLPKGTLISHRNLANLVTHFADQFDVMSTVSLLWLTTFSFDISALELFVPLARGGRVVVAPDRARTDGRTLAEAVVRHRVDIVQATPTTWRLVIDDAADVLSSCRVLCGGEPLPRDSRAGWRRWPARSGTCTDPPRPPSGPPPAGSTPPRRARPPSEPPSPTPGCSSPTRRVVSCQSACSVSCAWPVMELPSATTTDRNSPPRDSPTTPGTDGTTAPATLPGGGPTALCTWSDVPTARSSCAGTASNCRRSRLSCSRTRMCAAWLPWSSARQAKTTCWWPSSKGPTSTSWPSGCGTGPGRSCLTPPCQAPSTSWRRSP